MGDAADSPAPIGGQGPLAWPPGSKLTSEESLDSRCSACGRAWRVHVDLAGFRLRCTCDAWIQVAVPAGASNSGSMELELPAHVSRLPAMAPRRPAPTRLNAYHAPGALADASVDEQMRWNDRTIIELVLLMIAFVGPMLGVFLFATGELRAQLMPAASLLSSFVILAIGAFGSVYMLNGLKAAKISYFIEGFASAAGGAALAIVYSYLIESLAREKGGEFNSLRKSLGVPMTVFCIGVCPAIFEELAFRGLMHGRMQAIFGKNQGLLIAATAFAVAHGLQPGLPFQAALGVYLGFLRDRSDSLLPGMLVHFTYNTIIVIYY